MMTRSESSSKRRFDDAVREELEAHNLFWSFKNKRSKVASIREHEAVVSGIFECRNKKCKKESWPSGIIGITIRGYDDNQYDTIIWHQECLTCKQFDTPSLNEVKYVKRVTDRITVWEGVPIERPVMTNGEITRGPHRADRCAGCRAGRCKAASGTGRGSQRYTTHDDLATRMESLNME
jgi:hypothetical protein